MKDKKPFYKNSYFTLIGLIGILCFLMYFFIESPSEVEESETATIENDEAPSEHELFYGFDPASFNISSGTIQPNEFFSEILSDYEIDYAIIHKLANNVASIFNLKKLQRGKEYHILSRNGCAQAAYFIYVPDPYKYIVYNLENDPCAEIVHKDVKVKRRLIEGVINSSLWAAMNSVGAHHSLINKMERAYAWTVDFYHLQKGDTYKLWYEEKYIDDEVVGTGNLIAGVMTHNGKELYAIHYDKGVTPGYYNLEGRPMQKAFLKAPVKFYRISSRYNKNRFHPILKRNRPHLGTDYAASYGTPIHAVAAGIVTHATYTSGNGNYVKIKHDRVYETQYLHMSKFADGIKPGTYVEQGETIGYVGATGLATGPHVCFRFWQNGKQVDPLSLDLPLPEPMDAACLEEYLIYKDEVLQVLQSNIVKEESNTKSSDDV